MNVDSITREPLETWDAIQTCFDEFAASDSQWIFRGHSDSAWDIETTLERAISATWVDPPAKGESGADRRRKLNAVPTQGPGNQDTWKVELRLLREFKRRYHQFSHHLPESGDTMEWLSLMRHYGAPCRLVDFSYSWFVALFFAIEN